MKSSWVPDRPTSRGATAYHEAVVDSSWHKNNVGGLIDLVKNTIKDDEIVVDFGAGTGASAIYLLKKIKKNYSLWLVDNSPSWLGKAYDILHLDKRVSFIRLGKTGDRYFALNEAMGDDSVNHVVSANTVHLIPDIKDAFRSMYKALIKGGTFVFQSGNMLRLSRESGILTIDDSVNQVHDLALEMIRSDERFARYRHDLKKRIERESWQRKFVFPTPRPIDFYIEALKAHGFKNIKVTHKRIKVLYADWLNFLRVRRLQAGILPEVGGKEASPREELDRDALVTEAAKQLFTKLRNHNPTANATSFTAEWIYVYSEK